MATSAHALLRDLAPQEDLTYILWGDNSSSSSNIISNSSSSSHVLSEARTINTFETPLWSAKRIFGMFFLVADILVYAILLRLAHKRRCRLELEKVGDKLDETRSDVGTGTGDCTSGDYEDGAMISAVPRSLSFQTANTGTGDCTTSGDYEDGAMISAVPRSLSFKTPNVVEEQGTPKPEPAEEDASTGWMRFPPFPTTSDGKNKKAPKSAAGWTFFPPFPKQKPNDNEQAVPTITADVAQEGEGGKRLKTNTLFAPSDELDSLSDIEDGQHGATAIVDDPENDIEVGVSAKEELDTNKRKLTISLTESTLDLEDSSGSSCVLHESSSRLDLQQQEQPIKCDNEIIKSPPRLLKTIELDDDGDESIDIDAVCAAAGEHLDRSWSPSRRRSSLFSSRAPESFDPERFL